MAGYREYMPGQVWFYYNPEATKDLERRKELGAITCRPVVIVQAAFYPEWNDTVTVCPITSSDRRSGVYIDTTILKDGSIIEGGTILPYVLHTVKTKFLYPVISSNKKRKLISLSEEDWERVRNGYLYHLGEDVPEPEYITNWKHIDDFDRAIVIRDVRLAIDDFDDIVHKESSYRSIPRKSNNPILQTNITGPTDVENHMIASLRHYDPNEHQLYEDSSPFTTTRISDTENLESGRTKQIESDKTIYWKTTDVETFCEELYNTEKICAICHSSTIYDGSTVFKDILVADMLSSISASDSMQLIGLTISSIISNTGINSKSSASRFRAALRERFIKDDVIEVDDGGIVFRDNAAPEPFIYTRNTGMYTKTRLRRNAKRRKILFSFTREQCLEYINLSIDDFFAATKCPMSYVKALREDILQLYPNYLIENMPEDIDISTMKETIANETLMEAPSSVVNIVSENTRYPYWETLSPSEIHEIKSSSKRNLSNVSKVFGLSKERMKELREFLMSKPISKIPEYTTAQRSESCTRVIQQTSSDYSSVSSEDILIFCRCEVNFILGQYSKARSSNTPSKGNIRKLKSHLRRMIATDAHYVRKI